MSLEIYKKKPVSGFTNSHKQITDSLFIFGFGKPLVWKLLYSKLVGMQWIAKAFT